MSAPSDDTGVAAAHPDVELHVVCENYATHKHQNVKDWLAANPRATLHFTPASCSWLNMVEIFFGIITKQAIRRGSFHSVDELEVDHDCARQLVRDVMAMVR